MSTPIVINKTKEDSDIEFWSNFVENLHRNVKEIPRPFWVVEILVQKYLSKETPGSILDIGCETGKNAIPLIRAGHKVTLLDIAPNAIRYTVENLQNLGLERGIAESIVGKIENLHPKYGPFKAVIGSYTFSFIPPHLFEQVMKNNVLSRIERGGYFVGGFFGPQHAWATNPKLSILTLARLEALFSSMGFTICEKEEHVEKKQTVLKGPQIGHNIDIIAMRVK